MSPAYASPDSYVSIRGGRTRHHNQPRGKGSLVFVDLPDTDDTKRIRDLPGSVLRERRATLLVRACTPGCGHLLHNETSERAERLKWLLSDWDIEMSVGILHQPIGAEAWVETVSGEPQASVAAARAVELEGLLEFADAIWRPSLYHYRLPSGEHAAEFVKIGDAIRGPREAQVLASWLAPHLKDGTGFVLDTGTLTPVAEAASRLMERAGMKPGPTSVLEHYPRSAINVRQAVEDAAGDQGRVLGVISVNSSGAVRDRLYAALEEISGLDFGKVAVLVDKSPDPPELPRLDNWTPLSNRDPIVARGYGAKDICEFCKSRDRARIIPVNPFSLDGMLPAQLRPVMPSVTDATRNWELWEACTAHGAISVESRSELPATGIRPEGMLMPIRIEMGAIAGEEDFIAAVRRGLEKLGASEGGRQFEPGADLVLVPEHEHSQEGFTALWPQVADLLGAEADPEPFPVKGDFSAELNEKVATADRIIVFSMGVVTGWSLQRALVGVQHAHTRRDYELQGLALHARPTTTREWETLCNSYDMRLFSVWLSFLPERSPLLEERSLLAELSPEDFQGETRALLEERLRLCAGEEMAERVALFLGSTPEAHLTRNSIYGQLLDARTTYAAVGSAVAKGRFEHDQRAVPEVRMFEIPAMARSYYDPLILAAFLRWVQPHEAWWGWQPWEADRAARMILERGEESDLAILVPELTLAAAQGKVHEKAVEVLRGIGGQYLQRSGNPASELAFALLDRFEARHPQVPAQLS